MAERRVGLMRGMLETGRLDRQEARPGQGQRGRASGAEAILAARGPAFRVGTVRRSRFLLDLIVAHGLRPKLESAYFENLEWLLSRHPLPARPGRVVLGLGPGRCGSTSLTGLVATVPGACATHENPPLLDWRPKSGQLAFHLRRLALLTRHFSLVFDAAHWWLNAADAVREQFPDTVLVGLRREPEAIVRSFLGVKGVGPGTINHWAPPDAGLWEPSVWDRAYPHYPVVVPENAPLGSVKAGLIRRYVGDYYAAMDALAARYAERMLVVRTEELGMPAAQERIFTFLGGGRGKLAPVQLNAGTIADGALQFWF